MGWSTFRSMGHIMGMQGITRSLQALGSNVTIITDQSTYNEMAGFDFNGAEFVVTPDVSLDLSDRKEIQEEAVRIAIEAFDQKKYSGVFTETYPMGRGYRIPEVEPFLDHVRATKPETLIYGVSLDVPVPGDELTYDQMRALTEKHFDRILVQGGGKIVPPYSEFDHQMQKFEDDGRIQYMGYFLSDLPKRTQMDDKDREVVVSIGGAFFKKSSEDFYTTIMDSKPHTVFKDHKWRIFIGQDCPEDAFERIRKKADEIGAIIVQPNRAEQDTLYQDEKSYRNALADSVASISRGGINTTWEVVSMHDKVHSGYPAVILPHIRLGGGDKAVQEQTIRAKKLEEMGLLHMAPEEAMHNARALADIINKAHEKKMPPIKPSSLGLLKGIENMGRIVALDTKSREQNNPIQTQFSFLPESFGKKGGIEI